MELVKKAGSFTPDNEYTNWLADLKARISNTRLNIAVRANNQLILLYWSIGADIIEKHAEAKWGDKLLVHLSHDIQEVFPGVSGFSPRNLRYMRDMVELFSDAASMEIVPQVVAQFLEDNESGFTPQLVAQILSYLPWGHIRHLLDSKMDINQALFYVCKSIEHGWSRSVLTNMIDAKLYESSGRSINNFKLTIPGCDSDYATEIVKDPYNLNFLTLRENYKEKDLQAAIEQNLVKFLTELGQGFAYVGRQVRFEVDGEEFFCDLLFYHLDLRRYVVVELKTVKFQPEFVSKVNFYCNAVNHLVKRPDEGDTIGLLICKEKNDLVAQWTVENLPIPLAISKYELSSLLPTETKKIKEDKAQCRDLDQ